MQHKKLQWIKALMICSQLLLIVFSVMWLKSEYSNQREDLKKDLNRLFTNMQHSISDSLLLQDMEGQGGPVVKKGSINSYRPDTLVPVSLSPGSVHKLLSKNIGPTDAQRLFTMDTIAFNELFCKEMHANGWNFQSEWVNVSDSDKDKKSIFLKSEFFVKDKGVVIKAYDGYLAGKMAPQALFVIILLTVTAMAFRMAYNGYASQVKLVQLKDDFISNMTHELKTPIATVKVALEALQHFNVIEQPELSREYLGMAGAEMNRLELLATRVLNTTMLEQGKIYLQKERCNLKSLVEDAVASMRIKCDQYDAKVAIATRGEYFDIAADKLHLQGVIVNLIDNSIKYAGGPAHITISLEEAQGKIQLTVKDNGPGIPAEYTEKVFDKFFRVPTGNRHNTKGYGLGLSYAAQVMRQHNGQIAVQNLSEGGCMFTLSF